MYVPSALTSLAMIIICCVMLSCSDSSVQDMGTVILGKLESGSISKAQQLVMMPNRVRIKCNQQNSRIFTDNKF